jgi:hypothetical protein
MRTPLLIAAWMPPIVAAAQVPTKLAYQGRLTDPSGAPVAGVQTIKFEIFDDESAGISKWAETQSVAMSNGYYVVYLGEVTPMGPTVFDGTDRFLELTIGSAKLSPRQRIASVPYALVASRLSSKGNDYVLNQGTTPQSASFNIAGSGVVGTSLGVATASPTARIHAVGGAAVAGSGLVSFLSSAPTTLTGEASARFLSEVAPGDIIAVDTTSNNTQTGRVTAIAANDSLAVDAAWSGTGFVNRPFTIRKPVARFQATGTASAGVMVNGAGNVGIATNTPRLPLDIAGRVGVNGNPVILWQEFATPLIKEFSFDGLWQTMKNLPVSTSMPAGARYMLADVFITASADDHSNFVLGRGLTQEQNWVDPRGTQPSTVFGKAMARHAVTLTYPG